MDDLPILDQETLHRLDEWGGQKLRHQMIRLYLENSPARLDQLDRGIAAEGDLDDVEMASHSLKASAANVGLMRVSAIAARVEEAASEGRAPDLPELRERLTAAAREGETALRDLLSTGEV